MRFIVATDEIDHGNIALLAIPMAAPDTLFNALWVPGQIVVDNGLAELQVQSFCARLSTYEDFRTCAKLVHESKAQRNFAARPSSRRKPRALLLFPPRERLLRALVIVDAAEQGDVLFTEADGEKKLPQVFLRGYRFCKNDGLAAAMAVSPQIQNYFDGFLERARLGIVW